MYSKMHQNKYAYKLEIDITKTRCPICHRKQLTMNTMGDITCRCGYISSITPYVAGIRTNTNLDFKINKIKKEDNEEERS